MKSNQLLSIATAILVWLFAVSIYLISFQLQLLANLELQTNIFLSLGIIPSAYLGTYVFYKKEHMKPSYLALTYLSIATLLDTLITVPVFAIPAGSSYSEFFSDPVFYIILFELYIIVFYFGNQLTKTKKA